MVELYEANVTVTNICRTLQSEGRKITRPSVYYIIKKWKENKTIADKPRPIREAKDVTTEMLDFIDNTMKNDDGVSAPKLTIEFNRKFDGVNFSVSKVKRLRKKLGWLASKTKYCQLIREVNKLKRLAYAKLCLERNDTFDDVLWTDECIIQMEQNRKISYRRWWEPERLKPKAKHPYKVCVWGCITKFGAAPLVVFSGIMDGEFYSNEIIEGTLAPFIKTNFAQGHRFMQDNDPKHTCRLAKACLEKNGIYWWKTPPESPDMNPIENLWHEIKETLRSEVKSRTKDELLAGIRLAWSRITPEKCRKYISHLIKVIPKVVEREGAASGY